MKKARTTSARATAKKPAQPAPPADTPAVDKTPPAGSAKPKHGLGSLGRKSLERPEIVPSLLLIPAAPTPTSAAAQAPPPPPSLPAKKRAAAAGGKSSEHDASALVLYLRDELRSLLALLDEAPPSL
jgi:hypothetical protein